MGGCTLYISKSIQDVYHFLQENWFEFLTELILLHQSEALPAPHQHSITDSQTGSSHQCYFPVGRAVQVNYWVSVQSEHHVPYYWTGSLSLASWTFNSWACPGVHLSFWMQLPISWTLHEELLQPRAITANWTLDWSEALPYYLCSSMLTVFFVWQHKNRPCLTCSNCDDLFECSLFGACVDFFFFLP